MAVQHFPNTPPGALISSVTLAPTINLRTASKETVADLPAFVKVAAEIGVREVYLQRLVFFEKDAIGRARPDQALYEQLSSEEAHAIEEATKLAHSLGLTFSASGAASEPGMSLKREDDGSP